MLNYGIRGRRVRWKGITFNVLHAQELNIMEANSSHKPNSIGIPLIEPLSKNYYIDCLVVSSCVVAIGGLIIPGDYIIL